MKNDDKFTPSPNPTAILRTPTSQKHSTIVTEEINKSKRSKADMKTMYVTNKTNKIWKYRGKHPPY